MHAHKTVVHITREATHKIGGVGSVLEGIFTSPAYNAAVERSIIIGPLLPTLHHAANTLAPDGEVFYSSRDGVTEHPYKNYFADVERKFGVSITYGCCTFYHPQTGVHSQPEVILIDVTHANCHPVNALKGWLYDEFRIESNRFEHHPDFERYVRFAPAALAALRVIGVANPNNPAVLISHQYLGIPTILAAILDPLGAYKTLYYAHEVPTVRRIVEDYPGHDTMFYNAMKWASSRGYYLNDVFGTQEFCYRDTLVRAARYCDNIIAVSSTVQDELRFLGPELSQANIDLVFNGIPARPISLSDKHAGKQKLQQYCLNLLGFKPDYIFTHVARMSVSKGLWRDLRVLEHLDEHFQKEGKTALLFLLSTETPPRRLHDVRKMELQWDWPVAHREIPPDLSAGEAAFYTAVQVFNARSRHVKTVLVNQFGWDRSACGQRMPADMNFMDLRIGTDLEFGQSIYEPFGVSQLEPLSFGGLCVCSSICGCCDFVKSVNDQQLPDNVIIADYTQLPGEYSAADLRTFFKINQQQRDLIEHHVSSRVAQTILQRLPQNDAQAEELIHRGYEIAQKMSWNRLCQTRLLPALNRAYHRFRTRQIA